MECIQEVGRLILHLLWSDCKSIRPHDLQTELLRSFHCFRHYAFHQMNESTYDLLTSDPFIRYYFLHPCETASVTGPTANLKEHDSSQSQLMSKRFKQSRTSWIWDGVPRLHRHTSSEMAPPPMGRFFNGAHSLTSISVLVYKVLHSRPWYIKTIFSEYIPPDPNYKERLKSL